MESETGDSLQVLPFTDALTSGPLSEARLPHR